jgi:transposase
VVAERCPSAVRCADAFHVVAWATVSGSNTRFPWLTCGFRLHVRTR